MSDFSDKISVLEKRLRAIEVRNKKVELDKAWETSLVRRAIVALVTYILLSIYMLWLDVKNPWLNALIPTIGFVLSTLTLAKIKEIWLSKREKNQK